ncbi:MAG: tetratricopeptide repeat protein [Cyclobacteriaceae bacterium]
MKNCVFILSFLVLGQISFAQKIDSLESELSEYEAEDSVRVEILNQLGFEYWIVNPIQSIIYGQQAKALAGVIEDDRGLAFANRVIGVANWAKGSYDDGLTYLFDGLELYRTLQDTLGEANCLMNIGLVYADRFDDDKALEFYFDALRLFEATGAESRSATTYSKIATIFIKQGKFEAAEDFLRRAMKIHDEQRFHYGRMEVFNRFGLLNFAKKDYNKAISSLNRSLEISKDINDVEGKTKTLLDLAKVQLEIDQPASAEASLQEALLYAREIGSHKWLKEIYSNLQIVNRGKGDLNEAIYYYDQYNQERDSIFSEETVNNISKLEAQLATVEQERQIKAKEQQIVILEQQAKLQRSRIVILIVIIFLVAALSFIFVRSRQAIAKRREEKAGEIAERARQEVEFKNRELSSYTVNFVRKNRLFEDLIESIQEIKKRSTNEVNKDLISIEKTVKKHIQVDQDWEDFKLRFENMHQGFFDKLHKKFPSLTNNDLRLSVLVKMNFSIKELSEMLGISPESVKTARYRLKKKLNLPSDQTLNDFLNEIA